MLDSGNTPGTSTTTTASRTMANYVGSDAGESATLAAQDITGSQESTGSQSLSQRSGQRCTCHMIFITRFRFLVGVPMTAWRRTDLQALAGKCRPTSFNTSCACPRRDVRSLLLCHQLFICLSLKVSIFMCCFFFILFIHLFVTLYVFIVVFVLLLFMYFFIVSLLKKFCLSSLIGFCLAGVSKRFI